MKAELVQKLERSRDELWRALDGLTEAELTAPRVVGEWTIKDVVAPIAYWEQVIHAHVRESFTEGCPRPLPSDPREDAINRRESAKRRRWSWTRVRSPAKNG